MRWYLGIVWLFLVVLLSMGVLADTALDAAPGATGTTTPAIDASNRFLSAEVSRQIQAETEALKQVLIDNQDSDFRALDDRMQILKQNMILSVVGAAMLTQAIVAIFLMRFWRRHSLEQYQEEIISKQQEQLKEMKGDVDALQQWQQRVWTPQVPTETMSMQFGQAEAMNMSQMNAWQQQPAYAGAWQPPSQTVPYVYDLEERKL